MKDIRNLLIDCRIELRKLQREFQKTELCERLDLALQTLPETAGKAAAAPAPAPPPPPEKSQTASQVALAWQTAARDLKFTDPAIYQRLGEKVMRLLGAKTLVDPATEILQLQDRLAQIENKHRQELKAFQGVEMERDTLLGALKEAVPELAGDGDRLGVALAQINHLKSHGPAPSRSGGGNSGGHGGSVAPRAPSEPNVPTPEILAAVAAGDRKFSDDQRNWAIGEGMVLSGFQYTPVELIQNGDQQLAQLILDKRQG